MQNVNFNVVWTGKYILRSVCREPKYIKKNLEIASPEKSVARFSALFCKWGLVQPSAFKGINKGLSYLVSSWEENVNELQPYPFQRSSFNCLIWVDLIGGRSSIGSAFETNTAATGTPACSGILRTIISMLALSSYVVWRTVWRGGQLPTQNLNDKLIKLSDGGKIFA